MKQYQVVIIGAGPAGISAAIWSARLKLSTCIVEKERKIGGKLSEIHNAIVDYPGFTFSSGEELLESFEKHLSTMDVDVHLSKNVCKVDAQKREIYTGDGGVIGFHSLILAAGSRDRRLGIPGEHLVYRNSYSATRDRSLFRNKAVCVVGGGDRAFEGAWLLAEAGAQVWLVHHSNQYRARSEFRTKVFEHPNIRILPNTKVEAIVGDSQICAIKLVTCDGSKQSYQLPIDAVFVRIGVQPDSHLLEGLVNMKEDGTCQVDSYYATTHGHIYCVGDVQVEPDYSSIALAVGQGMVAAKRIALRIEEEMSRV